MVIVMFILVVMVIGVMVTIFIVIPEAAQPVAINNATHMITLDPFIL